MQNKNIIRFVRTTHRQYFDITVNGFRVGAIWPSGHVTDGRRLVLGYDPVTGLSKLLQVTIEEATEIFNRESLRLVQKEGEL
jgi:hypothetical protein